MNGYYSLASAMAWIIVGITDNGKDYEHLYDGDYYTLDDSPTEKIAYGFAAMHAFMSFGYFTSQSIAESEYKKIVNTYDSTQLEDAAYESLKYIAKKEKRRRLGRAFFSTALATAYVTIRPIQTGEGNDSFMNVILAFVNFSVGANNFASPSFAEKSLRRFNKYSSENNPLKVRIRTNYSSEIQLVLLKQL